MRVEVDKIRPAYKKAKKEFAKTWQGPDNATNDKFWLDFGNAHNMKITIDGRIMGFTRITFVDFADEKDYVWFMLRWA